MPGGGHIDLAGGGPVKAAGEVRLVHGQIKYIDNSSGHYLPSGSSAEESATTAFENAGLKPSDKYVEKSWVPDPSHPKGGKWRPVP